MKKNAISLHSSLVGRANLKTYINAAKKSGYDLIEPTKLQLEYFLKAGHTEAEVKKLLGDVGVSAIGWIADIEGQGHDFVRVMKEAEVVFDRAAKIGSHAVELINGPVDWHAVEAYQKNLPYLGYMGLQGLPMEEQERLTVKNLQALADLAAQYGLTLYFEPLCWTPIPSLKEGLPLVERADRENLKIVVDFYHNFMAGLTPDFIAGIDKDRILGVHICNCQAPDGNIPCEEIYRDAPLYGGAVNIEEWVAAVKSTGFDGWWTYETFSKEEAEEEVYEFTAYVYKELERLVRG